MNTYISSAVVVCVLWGASALPAAGQLVQDAPGAVGGIFGGHAPPDSNRSATRWTVTADLSAGQDTVPIESEGPAEPGPGSTVVAAGTAAISTRLWRGRTSRSFEASAGGFVNRQNDATDQLRGANAGLRGSVGTRTGLTGLVNAAYQPLQILNAVGVIPGAPITPITPGAAVETVSSQASVGPPNGVVEQPWLSMQTAASVFRNWTSVNRFDGTVSVWQWRPLEGEGLESTSTTVSLQQSATVSNGKVLRAVYYFERNSQRGITALQSRTRMHVPEIGMRFQKRLSPLRRMTTEVQAGITHAQFDLPGMATTSSVVPVGSASFQANVSRYWTIGVNASRDVAVLNVYSNQPFKTDQVGVQLAGVVARRLSLFASGGYSRGSSAVEDPGAFEGLSAVGRAQYGIANWIGVFGGYSYYRQELSQLQTPAGAFLTDFGRHAFRVGLTLWMPMYGTF